MKETVSSAGAAHEDLTVDVVVVGGGTGAVAAAVAAPRPGS